MAVVGPTASGKSLVAMELARRLRASVPVEIVSVDSMQVYRGMDVGTAKPTRAERAEVPHHLLDLVEPSERFTVARFAAAADAAIAAVEQRGNVAVVVGGTGLYVQALVHDLAPPGEFPGVRARLEADAAVDGGTGALHRRLAELDPAAAARIEPDNTRRVVRALEVTIGSGSPFSSYGPGVGAYPRLDRFALVGVWLPRAVIAARIGTRVTAMVERGLVEEVRALGLRTLGPTARQALGYKEVLAHVESGDDLGVCLDRTVRRTRQFARRQRAWFARDPRIRWHGTADDPQRLLPGLLAELDHLVQRRR